MKFGTRKREVHYFVDEIYIDGWWFGLDDLIETLEAVKEEDIFIRNKRMADALVKRKVLKHGGSRRSCLGAKIGPNYDQFLGRMREYKRVEEVKSEMSGVWRPDD